MKKEYCNVELDLSNGSAYEYNKDSVIPTVIKYGRMFDGKFQKGKIEGNFSNIKLHDIIFMIKRGCDPKEIYEHITNLK